MRKHGGMTRRKRNCLRITHAFSQALHPQDGWSELWVNWVDPLSEQSLSSTHWSKPEHHTFYVRNHAVHVPLDWYWREIADWEIEDLVTVWKLTCTID